MKLTLAVIFGVLALLSFLVARGMKRNITKREEEKVPPLLDTSDTITAPEVELLAFINGVRKNKVEMDVLICQLMSAHMNYMLKEGKASHDFEGARQTHLRIMGYGSSKEIVDKGFSKVESAFNGFMESDSHREVILDEKYNVCGISVNLEERYYCAMFSIKDLAKI